VRPVFAEATIDAPRERVFDLLCDLSRRPAFTDHFLEEFRLTRVDPSGPGAAVRFRIGSTWMDTAIEEAERPHLIRESGWGGRTNRIPVFTVWELAEGASDAACEVRLAFWSEPSHPLDRLRNPLGRTGGLRRDWRRALRRLQEIAESGADVEPVTVAGADRIPAFVR
jgi:hypothetical protein